MESEVIILLDIEKLVGEAELETINSKV